MPNCWRQDENLYVYWEGCEIEHDGDFCICEATTSGCTESSSCNCLVTKSCVQIGDGAYRYMRCMYPELFKLLGLFEKRYDYGISCYDSPYQTNFLPYDLCMPPDNKVKTCNGTHVTTIQMDEDCITVLDTLNEEIDKCYDNSFYGYNYEVKCPDRPNRSPKKDDSIIAVIVSLSIGLPLIGGGIFLFWYIKIRKSITTSNTSKVSETTTSSRSTRSTGSSKRSTSPKRPHKRRSPSPESKRSTSPKRPHKRRSLSPKSRETVNS